MQLAIRRPFTMPWTFAFAAVSIAIVAVSLAMMVPIVAGRVLGGDFLLYREAAQRWLDGGGFYQARQLAGPYTVLGAGEILYPPITLFLFLPFLVLPTVLWFAIPLGIIAWRVYALHPAPWTWPVLAFCAAWPPAVEFLWNGNPSLWVAAAVALATRWPALSPLVLLKPSLFPFALFGIRRRGWWLTVAAMAALSLLVLPLDLQWVQVTLDARGPYSGVFYSLMHVPFVALPLVAWLGRARTLEPERGE